MQEERRVVGTLQETFIKQISDLSKTVAVLNSNMSQHTETLREIKEQGKELSNLMLTVERNSYRIETLTMKIDKHDSCSAPQFVKEFQNDKIPERLQKIEHELSGMGVKISAVIKVLAALGAGLVPIFYKLFYGG